jgi:hypothetical protein
MMIASSVLFGLNFASADTYTWVRIMDDATNLYTNPSEIKVTLVLEKSYYLRVLDTLEQFYQVQLFDGANGFLPITGYVLKDKVALCDTIPLSPTYPTVTVTVSANSTALYFSPLNSSQMLIVATNTQQMNFYGRIQQNDITWYYVRYGNVFGYVDSRNVTAPMIALHPTPLPMPEQPPVDEPANTEPSEEPTATKVSAAEILMIVFVAFLSVGLVLALFLPQKAERKEREDRYIS